MGYTRGSKHVCAEINSVLFKASNNHVIPLALVLALALFAQAAFAEDGRDVSAQAQRPVQRLVRRNFLRFGKRSGPVPAAAGHGAGTSKRSSSKAEAGEGEQYEASLMSGQHPHKSNTRSFLRFGKRADNFLRFGRTPMHEVSQDDLPLYPYTSPAAVASAYYTEEVAPGNSWESRLLQMLSRINQGDDEDDEDESLQGPEDYKLRHQQEELFNQYAQYAEKKANDFLRFGRRTL